MRMLRFFSVLISLSVPGWSSAQTDVAPQSEAEIAYRINQRNFGRSARHRIRMELTWARVGEGTLDGRPVVLVEQRPVTAELAENLGVSRIPNHVDPTSWRHLKIEYWDVAGQPLKLLRRDARGGDEPAMVMRNLQTGHETVVTFIESHYDEELDDELFTLRGIERESVR